MLKPILPSMISSRGVKYYVPVREERPEYDLDTVDVGERIVSPPSKEFTKVEESTAEWDKVLDILPPEVVPDPPVHDIYPTPSGWLPPKASALDSPYFVRRNRFHNYPVYLELLDGGQKKMTVTKNIEGDIWQMESDLRKRLQKNNSRRINTQVDEICRKIRVRGVHLDDVSDFLKDRGF